MKSTHHTQSTMFSTQQSKTKPGGRSGGCRTCRMRHVKCDEQKPECARCIKAKMECRGYDVLEIFVDERSKTIQRSNQKVKRKDTTSHSIPNSSDTCTTSEQLSSRRRALDSESGPLMEPLVSSFEELYVNFTLQRLSGHPLGKHAYAAILEDVWHRSKLDLDKSATALDYAAAALSAAFYGKLQRCPQVAELALTRYGLALRKLKDELASPRWSDSDTLCTAMCLIMIESLTFTSPNAWKGHAVGAGKLIEAKGPSSFKDSKTRLLFRSNRMPIMFACLMDEKPCFLDRQEWKTVPWEDDPGSKQPEDYLFDIYACIPGFTADAEMVEAMAEEGVESPQAISEFKKDLLARGVTKLKELVLWRWNWERMFPNAATIISSADQPRSMFASTLSFKDSAAAHMIGLYDSLLLFLLKHIRGLAPPGFDMRSVFPDKSNMPAKQNPMLLPGYDGLDGRAIAHEICRCIKYRLDHMSNAVIFGLFVPVRMAWAVLRYYTEERNWLRKVAYVLEQRSGLAFHKLAMQKGQNPLASEEAQQAAIGRGEDEPLFSPGEVALQVALAPQATSCRSQQESLDCAEMKAMKVGSHLYATI